MNVSYVMPAEKIGLERRVCSAEFETILWLEYSLGFSHFHKGFELLSSDLVFRQDNPSPPPSPHRGEVVLIEK